MRIQPRALACAAALSLAALMAQAAVVTKSKSFNLVAEPAKRSEVGSGLDGGGPLIVTVDPTRSASQVLSFERFDGSLGTLTGVTFWLLGPAGSDVLSIQGVSSFSGKVTASGTVSRLLSGVPNLADIGLDSPSTLDCVRDFDDACSQTFAHSPPATGAGGQALSLAGFVGAGSFDITAGLKLDAPTLAYEFGADCSTVLTSLTSNWSGTVKIEYTYTEPPPPAGVPEPASFYLAGAALLAAGWWRRRRAA